METDWCAECQTLLRCDCSKLERQRFKDLMFGDQDWTVTIYITFCLTCGEKHDVQFG
jgi:hypothetical protein